MPREASNPLLSSNEDAERLAESNHASEPGSHHPEQPDVSPVRTNDDDSADIAQVNTTNRLNSRSEVPFMPDTSDSAVISRDLIEEGQAASFRDGDNVTASNGKQADNRLPLPVLSESHASNNSAESHAFAVTDLGLSDDGRSLTPEPQSSEAETEHIISEDEMGAQPNAIDEAEDESEEEFDTHQDEEPMEVPDDLDNLSDTDSLIDAPRSPSEFAAQEDYHDEALPDEEAVDLEEDMDARSASQSSERSSHIEEMNGADIIASLATVGSTSTVVDTRGVFTSPPRKRKRSSDVSPIVNTKRLAPRKIAAELDSDEEEADSRMDNTAGSVALDDEELKESLGDGLITGTAGDSEHAVAASSNLLETQLILEVAAGAAAAAAVEAEEEEDEEEAEEEVQDDTEREERNRHRQAAMEALRQIEIDFARLRARLYEERMTQIEREITLADSCQHPLLIEKAAQNRRRHAGRTSRAEVLRDRRKIEAELEFKAQKFMAHSQFAQDKQKLRGTLLSNTSAEWFQIHREKRVLDMAVPEYGYVLSERKSIQAKQRREFEAEVGILAGLKKFVGFPAAPPIPVASSKEIDSDLSQIGILRNSASFTRDSHRTTHHVNSSSHGHTSTAAHPNHSHSSSHTYVSHQASHSKTHHHRKPAQLARRNVNLLDHRVSANHNGSRTSSPQPPIHQQFQAHAYHPEALSRNPAAMPATFVSSNEQERKSVIHPVQQDIGKPRDIDRDRLPFPNSLAHHSAGSFTQSGPPQNPGMFGQKQAQNLPNILRQDMPDKQRNLPNPSHLTNGTHQPHHEIAGGHAKGFATQFWNTKLGEAARVPAPAVSSNSAFNATLAQPGGSAAYIPPKTYSPAAQSQGPAFKPNPVLHSMAPTTSSSKGYQPLHSFPSQASPSVKEPATHKTTPFPPNTQPAINGDDRAPAGPMPPKQEQ